MHVSVHSGTLHRSGEGAAAQMSTGWRADEHTVWRVQGILVRSKEERSTDSCYNVRGPHKHYAEEKKPEISGEDKATETELRSVFS